MVREEDDMGSLGQFGKPRQGRRDAALTKIDQDVIPQAGISTNPSHGSAVAPKRLSYSVKDCGFKFVEIRVLSGLQPIGEDLLTGSVLWREDLPIQGSRPSPS